MIIAMGSDHRGFDSLKHIADHLRSKGHDVRILGPDAHETCDYPDAAYLVAAAVAAGEAEFGVLMDGTGIGSCIAANKVRGVRAALLNDELSAQMSRSHNDANVVCLPADLLGVRLMFAIIETCLNTPFSAGRHARRNEKIAAIERGENPASPA
ncbi:MAG: ribose 5-phosphate isomerase B [Phycisphaerales bacterium]|nr:MAG: ribose 5-phosphate isomerase B [Phycisphaerales bacterium]